MINVLEENVTNAGYTAEIVILSPSGSVVPGNV